MAAIQGIPAHSDVATATAYLQALQDLRLGLSQARLYAEGTPQYIKAVDAAFTSLMPLVEGFSVLEISIYRGAPLINGRELEVPFQVRPAIEAIERFFWKAGLYCFKFSAGLATAELSAFLQLLAWNKFGTTDGEKVNAYLRAHGIRNIAFVDSNYIELRAGKHHGAIAGAKSNFVVPSVPAAQAPISGLTQAVEPPVSPAHSSTVILPSIAGVDNLKVTLEGRIEVFGFINVLRLVGGKDGVLSLQGPAGEARIAIKARTIVNASYAGKTGSESLIEISEILSAPFAYLAGSHDIPNAFDIKISDVERLIERCKRVDRHKDNIDYF